MITWLIVGVAVTLTFQNCDTTQPTSDGDSITDLQNQIVVPTPDTSTFDLSDEVEVIPADTYSKARIYSVQSYLDSVSGNYVQPYVEVDLENKEVVYKVVDGATMVCDLHDEDFEVLNPLLTDVALCGPPPPDPDLVQCLAMSVPDIFLSNNHQDVDFGLSEPICGNGQWLCQVGNQQLRSILSEIANDSAPSGCVAQ
tara:strand:- start:33692 stop:34285 length:594 start_codon:yes stop_codon:yes gene_type:complete